jgi:hypothetical protein
MPASEKPTHFRTHASQQRNHSINSSACANGLGIYLVPRRSDASVRSQENLPVYALTEPAVRPAT